MIFVHKLFEGAITNGLRQDNPCNGLRRLPQQHKEMSYYTSERFNQFNALFAREEYQYQLLYHLLMYTGLRIGEALALTWKCIILMKVY